MKRLIAVMLLVSGALHAQAEDPAIAGARVRVAESMFDAQSARFRDLARASDGSGTVCGWVNGKNRLGAYAGYAPFVVIGGGLVKIRDSNDSPNGLGLFAESWAKCFPHEETRAGDTPVKLPRLDVAKECNKRREAAPDQRQIYEGCEDRENAALAWLQSHPTDKVTAQTCRVDAYTYRSYVSAKHCVYGLESRSWFYLGPRPGTPETGTASAPAAPPATRYRCTDADGKPYVTTAPTSGCVVE